MMPAAALCAGIVLAAGLWPFGGDEGRDGARAGATIRSLEERPLEVKHEPPAVDSSF